MSPLNIHYKPASISLPGPRQNSQTLFTLCIFYLVYYQALRVLCCQDDFATCRELDLVRLWSFDCSRPVVSNELSLGDIQLITILVSPDMFNWDQSRISRLRIML